MKKIFYEEGVPVEPTIEEIEKVNDELEDLLDEKTEDFINQTTDET